MESRSVGSSRLPLTQRLGAPGSGPDGLDERVQASDLAPLPGSQTLRRRVPQTGHGPSEGSASMLPGALRQAQALLGDDPAGFTGATMAYVRAQGLRHARDGQTYNRHADPVYQCLCLHTRAYARAQRLKLERPTAQALRQEVQAEVALLQERELRKPSQTRALGPDMNEMADTAHRDTKREPRQSDRLAHEWQMHGQAFGIPQGQPVSDGKAEVPWKQAREQLGPDPSQWPQRIDQEAGQIRRNMDRWKETKTLTSSIETLRTMEHLDDNYQLLGGPGHPAGESKGESSGSSIGGAGVQSLVDRIERCGLNPERPLGAFEVVVREALGNDPGAYGDRAEQYLAERIRTAGGVEQAGGMSGLEADPVYVAMRLRATITAYHPDGGTSECVGPFNRAMVDCIAARFEARGVRTPEQFMDEMQSGRHGNPFMARAIVADAANLLLEASGGPRHYRDWCTARLSEQEDALGDVSGARLRARSDPVHAAMSLRAELAQILIRSGKPCTAAKVEQLARKCETGYGILDGDTLKRLVAASGRHHVVASFLSGGWDGLTGYTSTAAVVAYQSADPAKKMAITQGILPLAGLTSDHSPLQAGSLLPGAGMAVGELAGAELGRSLGALDSNDENHVMLMIGCMAMGGALGSGLGASVQAWWGGSLPAWLDDGPLTARQVTMLEQLRTGTHTAPGAWWEGLRLRNLNEAGYAAMSSLANYARPLGAIVLNGSLRLMGLMSMSVVQFVVKAEFDRRADPAPVRSVAWPPSAVSDPAAPQFPVAPAGDDKAGGPILKED